MVGELEVKNNNIDEKAFIEYINNILMFYYQDNKININYEKYKSILLKTQKLREEYQNTIKNFDINEEEWDTKLLLNRSPIIRNLYISYLEILFMEEDLKNISMV